MPSPYQPPRWAPPRKHGLQTPFSRDQLGAMILYPLLTMAFYLIAAFYLPDDYLALVMATYTALVLISVFCWAYISLTDPSKPGGIPCRCMAYTQAHSRYCASCRKSVPGLDHHCLWLNTCIGARNYFFFFLLSLAGTLQFALQSLISILLLTHWLNTTEEVPAMVQRTLGRAVTYQAILIIHTAMSGIALLSFASLCVFHGYLLTRGLGTYDWILRQRVPSSASSGTSWERGRRTVPAPGGRMARQGSVVVVGSTEHADRNGSQGTDTGNDNRPDSASAAGPVGTSGSHQRAAPTLSSQEEYVGTNVPAPPSEGATSTKEENARGTDVDGAIVVDMEGMAVEKGLRNGETGSQAGGGIQGRSVI